MEGSGFVVVFHENNAGSDYESDIHLSKNVRAWVIDMSDVSRFHYRRLLGNAHIMSAPCFERRMGAPFLGKGRNHMNLEIFPTRIFHLNSVRKTSVKTGHVCTTV